MPKLFLLDFTKKNSTNLFLIEINILSDALENSLFLSQMTTPHCFVQSVPPYPTDGQTAVASLSAKEQGLFSYIADKSVATVATACTSSLQMHCTSACNKLFLQLYFPTFFFFCDSQHGPAVMVLDGIDCGAGSCRSSAGVCCRVF